ncbi:ribonuclease HIII [bacterium]|nr:ribonuclease HIII [bacterium]
MAALTSYTCPLRPDKVAQLRRDLGQRGFEFRDVVHAQFGASSAAEKVNLALYHNGKLVIQGKGTREFIEFYLEPVLLGEARLGYEHIHNPEILASRLGVDESGKGDFFGPLVCAGVFVDGEVARKFQELHVRDSKLIQSDARIEALAKEIRAATAYDVVPIGNEAYNRLQVKMGNVNNLLGWGHARVIENLLAKIDPDGQGDRCPKAISDQFGNARIVKQSLMERGRRIELVQRHKAEADLAVAAASILARAEFVRRLRRVSKEFGVDLPKGASAAVRAAGVEVVTKHGPDALAKVAKLHFRTAEQVRREAKV